MISGLGFAIAKMIGCGAIEATISGVNAPLTERPNAMSAPSIASSRVRFEVATAWADFHWFMPSVRPWNTTPLVSHRITFSERKPSALTSSMQAMPAAPAPLTTSLARRCRGRSGAGR